MARELSEREINKIYNGDCLAVIKTFPDKSIDCVITSPPYWLLRDYKWEGQWGLEPNFLLYLDNLWSLMDEIYRVLKDEGTVWINLGDTYSGSGKGAVKIPLPDTKELYIPSTKPFSDINEPDKCLLLIPHRFAIGCIDRGWVMRNDIIWAKRNAMPESVTDRFSKKHEYFFFMVKSDKYYFDLDGIRDKLKNPTPIRNKASEEYGRGSSSRHFSEGLRIWGDKDKGKNPGTVSDFWDINTKPSSEEHYATFSDTLIGRPIVAGCQKGGIILDPFCGTGTTGCRAIELGRNFIGIEGSEEYCKIAEKRIKPYLSAQKLF